MIPFTTPHPCERCGVLLDEPALAFLHAQVHAEPVTHAHYSLRMLPLVLMPRIARLMQDYADAQQPRGIGEMLGAGTNPEDMP